jgi:N-acetylglucosaminyldiphosphoundecaprenol N-acetyl-beta-D-mannosaminyltransferase
MGNQINQIRKCDVLGISFDFISCDVAMDTIECWRADGECHYVAITNPHSVMMCYRDTEMRRATEMAGMTLPDGVGIVFAARLLGYPHNGRVTGPFLMLKLCDWGRKYGYRHYFYGGAQGVAEKLSENLKKKYPGLEVAGTCAPPFRPVTEQEDRNIVDMINSKKPDILWVGLGAPKQEIWMAAHLGRIHATAMIGVGAAFDFHSGNVKWSPAWIRKLGLEWVYRLAQDPKRMWRRNLESPLFLTMVLCLAAAKRIA